jgi:hypothetical protein
MYSIAVDMLGGTGVIWISLFAHRIVKTRRIGLDIPDGNPQFRSLPNILCKSMVRKGKAVPVVFK